MLLENTGVEIPEDNKVKIYIASMGESESAKAFEIATKIRNEGIICEIDHMNRGIKAQFKYADKIGAEYVAVIGSNELEKGEVNLKKMADGSQTLVKLELLPEYLERA